MSRPERASGWGKPVVSRETRGPSFRHSLRLSCLALLLTVAASACGYVAVRSGEGAALSVRTGPTGQPDLAAVQAALAGARSELTTLGSLAPHGYPALVVEVFHVQEASSGVMAPSGSEQPLARGSTLALQGRAWIVDSAAASPRSDTGLVTVQVAVASAASAEVDSGRYDAALRRAARQLGRTLARRALGLPGAAVGR